MSVKRYGIFLGWQPNIKLTGEGIGRHLASMLKASKLKSDVRFTLVCPSWTRQAIIDLCKSEGVNPDNFDLWSPEKEPVILRLLNWLSKPKKPKKKKERDFEWIKDLLESAREVYHAVGQRILGARSIFVMLLLAALVAIPAIAATPFILLGILAYVIWRLLALIIRKTPLSKITDKKYTVRGVLGYVFSPIREKRIEWARHFYRLILERENTILLDKIEGLHDVQAWYTPAAFWPSFNKIKKPRVMCVPDVVTSQFPVPFALLLNDNGVSEIKRLEKAIREGYRFITYSETIKWSVLVDQYGVDSSRITVIPHAASTLDGFIALTGFKNADDAILSHCQSLVERAVHRNAKTHVMQHFNVKNIRYLFYPTQFRPTKNILALLTAFSHLLKTEHLGIKLFLTGDPDEVPAISKFVEDNNLGEDVLFLRRVSTEELAACYKLAELAVNTSLAEGGCPFTLTEALSVGTPVIMSRIAVTEEVITSEAMKDLMLFNPYDWKVIADKISWALRNRDALLTKQKAFYDDVLSKRDWNIVLSELVGVFDKAIEHYPADVERENTEKLRQKKIKLTK